MERVFVLYSAVHSIPTTQTKKEFNQEFWSKFSEFKESVKIPLTQEEKLALINFSKKLYSSFDYSVLFDLFLERNL